MAKKTPTKTETETVIQTVTEGTPATAADLQRLDDVNNKITVEALNALIERRTRRAQGEPVIVFTDRRGVFFGWTKSQNQREMVLTNSRMCLFWSEGGALRLAGTGPVDGDRLSAESPEDLWLPDVHAVAVCTPQAAAAWKKMPTYKG